MAIQTFTSGQILTAADTNTYLANSGLVYVTSGTLSLATNNFVGCFTSTYSNYVVTIDQLGSSASTAVWFRMLTGSTAFTTAVYSYGFNGYTTSGDNSAGNASFQQGYSGTNTAGAGTNQSTSQMTFFSPQISGVRTFVNATGISYAATPSYRTGFNTINDTSAFDGLQILSTSAITLSGNVTIYGYRKA